jgi:hypothetical protein
MGNAESERTGAIPMADVKQFAFSYKEIAEILVKKQDLHEGIWGIFVKFGISGVNVGSSDVDIRPAAVVPILEIGLQRFEAENNLAVDAAKVNPAEAAKSSRPSRKR